MRSLAIGCFLSLFSSYYLYHMTYIGKQPSVNEGMTRAIIVFLKTPETTTFAKDVVAQVESVKQPFDLQHRRFVEWRRT